MTATSIVCDHWETDVLFPQGHWLLCPPTYFDVAYEINPWMSIQRSPSNRHTARQWRTLHHTLIRLGAFVEYLEPHSSNPDLVFTANAGLVCGDKVALARFRHPERQTEEAMFRSWFTQHEYEIYQPHNGYFEGEGDALFAGDLLVCGYGFRSDKTVFEGVAQFLGVNNILLCGLADSRFYHLDTCFCPLTDTLALYYEPAFTADSITALKRQFELIAVSEAEALRFACNAITLGQHVIIPNNCGNTVAALAAHGYQAHSIVLDEFIKGGGAAKCLALRLHHD